MGDRYGEGVNRKIDKHEEEKLRHRRLRVDELRWKKIGSYSDEFEVLLKARELKERGLETDIREEKIRGNYIYVLYSKHKNSSFPWSE